MPWLASYAGLDSSEKGAISYFIGFTLAKLFADIRTTMNVYGKAMDESKHEAHGKVFRLVLPSKAA